MISGTEAGKRFEEKFKLTMERAGLIAMRIPDVANVRSGVRYGRDTMADFVVMGDGVTCLVECKATSSRNLRHDRVHRHQVRSLLDVDAMEGHMGLLAVEFFDRRGYRFPHRMYLLPVSEWVRHMETSGRKSMPEGDFARLGVELPYSGSSYVFDGRWSR